MQPSDGREGAAPWEVVWDSGERNHRKSGLDSGWLLSCMIPYIHHVRSLCLSFLTRKTGLKEHAQEVPVNCSVNASYNHKHSPLEEIHCHGDPEGGWGQLTHAKIACRKPPPHPGVHTLGSKRAGVGRSTVSGGSHSLSAMQKCRVGTGVLSCKTSKCRAPF